MSSQNLSITQTGAVARITLTQPEIRNAFSDEVIAEITAAFAAARARNPPGPAIIDDRGTLPFEELHERSNALGADLVTAAEKAIAARKQ